MDNTISTGAPLARFASAALLSAAALLGCTNTSPTSEQPVAQGPDSKIARGEYLTTLLGCGQCHTEGAMLGRPTGSWLAGSTTGVAYTADAEGADPGIVFPSNLTPDNATGLGTWSEDDIVFAIGGGQNHSGHRLNAVMPWMNYSLVRGDDLRAIAAFLKSLPPVAQKIPENIAPGAPVTSPYIRIGIYRFSPSGVLESVTEPPAGS